MKYETPEDRARSAAAMTVVERAFSCQMRPTEPMHYIDYVSDSHACEHKHRHHTAEHVAMRFGSVYLETSKYDTLMELHSVMGFLPIFVVSFNCGGVYWVDVRLVDTSRTVIIRRRVYRCPHDEDPAYEVPWELFRLAGNLFGISGV